jgi:7-cyano-7-deazaguanine synthase
VVPVASLRHLGGSGLTDPEQSVRDLGPDALPTSFVPGRNLLFLIVAAAYAYRRQIDQVVMGVCQTDFSGYPDCRDGAIKAMQVALQIGLGRALTIHTPLMWLSKAETVRLAETLPGCRAALAWSHTCYEGAYPPCGTCPACVIRARGFSEAGVPDPLIARADAEGLVRA